MIRAASFTRLALWTTATTYFLILVGGLVRASGAGLGCPDWPRCFGTWIPPLSAADLPPGFVASQFNPTLMWTEYLNRILGVIVGLLIFATLIAAWRHHRRTPQIFWPTLAAFLLVGFQGWLGGVVVQQALAAWIVTVHMLVALVIVSLLLFATVYAVIVSRGGRRGRKLYAPAPRRGLLIRCGIVALVLTLLQVALGTQVRERIDEALSDGVARDAALLAVGPMDTWHRESALVVLAAAALCVALVRIRHRQERPLVNAANAVAVLVLGQLALGAALAYLGLKPAAQVAHLIGASLLIGAQTILVLLARWTPGSATFRVES